MIQHFATGYLPYEPKDKVTLKLNGENIFVIEDIRMIQTVVANTIQFEVQLSINGFVLTDWFDASVIDKRIIKEKDQFLNNKI